MPYFESRTVDGYRPGRTDPLLGTWLDGRFLIEERIATGGFGAVYRARTADGAPIAVKVLHPSLTDDPSMVARFRREGATLTQLHDPHTVTTLAVGETDDGTLYIAMELLTGESLHDRLLRERALPWQTAAAIARSVCSSLAEAHALGVVHRDLKPANIHVDGSRGDTVKVIDFGIVKLVRGSAIDDGKELTFAGHMIGTCDYMSPEQIVGGTCDAASDIYSLGVVLYEMLTGRRPFPRATTAAAMVTALLTQTPQAPSILVALPPALDRVVMRCLERESRHRFASTAELAAALDRVLAVQPTAREEVTAVHPVLGATLVDEGLWFSPEVRRSRPTPPRPGPARAEPAQPAQLADGTGPVERTPQNLPVASQYGTLPGVAVATERRSSPRVCPPAAQHPSPAMSNPGLPPATSSPGLPPATSNPGLPPGWRATPRPQPSTPPPPTTRAPVAGGELRPIDIAWLALALVAVMAIAFTVVMAL